VIALKMSERSHHRIDATRGLAAFGLLHPLRLPGPISAGQSDSLATRPLRHGEIVDFDIAEDMRRYFIRKVRQVELGCSSAGPEGNYRR
jgi:hypothetical protein